MVSRLRRKHSSLIPEARELVYKLSAQRVRHELELILDETNAASMLSRLDKLGLLNQFIPACDGIKPRKNNLNLPQIFPLRLFDFWIIQYPRFTLAFVADDFIEQRDYIFG